MAPEGTFVESPPKSEERSLATSRLLVGVWFGFKGSKKLDQTSDIPMKCEKPMCSRHERRHFSRIWTKFFALRHAGYQDMRDAKFSAEDVWQAANLHIDVHYCTYHCILVDTRHLKSILFGNSIQTWPLRACRRQVVPCRAWDSWVSASEICVAQADWFQESQW